jgi:hypothetical protein
MRISGWNCRGLGNGPAELERLKKMLGMGNMIVKDCE